MPNYQNGRIYQLTCNITGQKYIGSTTQKLCRRLTGHVTDYKRGRIMSSGKIIANGNYSIILIEEVDCDNKEQLLKRERFYIESMDCVNKQIPMRTDAEYRCDNIEKYKLYRISNKDKLKQQKQEYYIDNKEKTIQKQKKYNIDNKEKIQDYKKQYYNNKKQEINARRAEKFQCPKCDKMMRNDSIKIHLKTMH